MQYYDVELCDYLLLTSLFSLSKTITLREEGKNINEKLLIHLSDYNNLVEVSRAEK